MKKEPIETISYKGFDIEVYYDFDPLNPRKEFDNLTTMLCWHRNYHLGDEQIGSEEPLVYLASKFDPDLEEKLEEIEEELSDSSKFEEMKEKLVDSILDRNCIYLPLYLYEHSGITIRTSPFSCRWDSGQVGIVFISKPNILENFGSFDLEDSLQKKAEEIIKGEVELYDDYLTGNVYGFRIRKDGEEIDSCWGYYGDSGRDDMIEYCEELVDFEIVNAYKKHFSNLKNWIKNKVPLSYRKEFAI